MRVRLWIIGGLAAVIGLAVALILILTLLLDANVFRGQIEAAVRDATGRPFEIRGDLDIKWFPWLAVHSGAAQLGNAPGMEGAPLLEWQSARVGAKLIPLLRGQLIIDGIQLQNPRISLRSAPDGRANWDDLFKPSNSNSSARASAQIGGIELVDGELDYVDASSGTHVQLRGWQLDVGEWKAGQEVQIGTEATVISGERTAELRIQTKATLSEDSKQLDLRTLQLTGRLKGGKLPPAGLDLALSAPQFQLGFSPFTIAAPELTARLADAQIAASIQASQDRGTENSVRAAGSLSIQVASLRKLLADTGLDTPLPQDAQAFGALAFSSKWAYVDGAMAVKPIEMQIDETRLTGELNRSAADPAVWQFQLHGDRIDLARYVPAEDPDAEPFELPVAALRALPVRGELVFEQARFANATIRKMRVRVEHETP